MSYATTSDMEATVEGWVTDNPTILARYLARASRDVDRAVGAWGPRAADGSKFGDVAAGENLHALRSWQLAALRRATCQQAYARTLVDDQRAQAGASTRPDPSITEVAGPDFTVTYQGSGEGVAEGGSYPLVSAAIEELAGAGLIHVTATVAAGPRRAFPPPPPM